MGLAGSTQGSTRPRAWTAVFFVLCNHQLIASEEDNASKATSLLANGDLLLGRQLDHLHAKDMPQLLLRLLEHFLELSTLCPQYLLADLGPSDGLSLILAS